MTTMGEAGSGRPAGELHVSSLLVQSRPERTRAIADKILAMSGADVPTQGEGRLVVTLVTGSERAILDAVEAIRELPGVLSAQLVFHRIERDEEAVG